MNNRNRKYWTFFGGIKYCPICEKKLESDRKCRNGCFEDNTYYLSIFGKVISSFDIDCEEKFAAEVLYWKKNERYLAKIISGNG